MNDHQRRHVMALAGELGYNRAQRLAAATNILALNHPLKSFTDLEHDQAATVIAAFSIRRRQQLAATTNEDDPF